MADWHSPDKKEVLKNLSSNEEGLSEKEAFKRLKQYGLNQLKEIKKIEPLKIFLSQFASILIYILIAAAFVSALLQHWLDFWVISGIVLLNATLGFVQQYKAEKTIQELKQLLVPQVKVLREGKLKKMLADYLVPGDILMLHEGDKIPADARLLASEDLQTNEAVLTGESMPVDKIVCNLRAETELVDRINMIYMGTTVTRGNAKAVVVSTGMETEFGKIAHLVQEIKTKKTPLQKKLDVFAKQIGLIILGLAGIILLAGVIAGLDKLQMFLTAVALAVSAIPEGLPAILTLCLALATRRLLKVNALVRKLPASETLGSVSVICADKTGTMTAEEMIVTHVYCNNHLIVKENIIKRANEEEINLLLKIGCLCNNARVEKHKGKKIFIGDPTEKALLAIAERAGLSKASLTSHEPRMKEFAFTSARKLMSIVRKSKETGKITSYIKGAADVILERCTFEIINGKIRTLTKQRKIQLYKEHEKLASSQALRVLGFAFKKLPSKFNQKSAENNLVFVGFQGMLDPPRPEVKLALQKCKEAGIKVIMITGDSALTAKAIANQINLQGNLLTAGQLDKMNDKQLTKAVKETTIFARVSPEHKLRIIEALKRNKEIVAVTGDGVNDVLALKRADIGIAMGIRGTDVARDVSDIILLDDNFSSIVKAVEEGRTTYSNTKKFTKFLLSCNFSELGLVMWSILARLPLPLLPLQILWINLVTDSMPALALGVEPAEAIKKSNNNESILKGMLGFIVFGGLLAFLAGLGIFYLEYLKGTSIEKTRTMVLTTSILFQMFFVFTCRSDKSLFEKGLLTNKWLIVAVSASILLHLFLIYGPLGFAFSVAPLSIFDLSKVAIISISGLLIFEIVKLVRRK